MTFSSRPPSWIDMHKLVMVVTLAASSSARAGVSLGAGAGIVVPVGDWADRSGPGFDLQLDARERLDAQWTLVQRLQPIVHLDDADDDHTFEASALVGIELRPVPFFFAMLATGITRWQLALGEEKESAWGIPLSFAAGVRLTRAIDLAIGVYSPDVALGGLTTFEGGAHGSALTLGITSTLAYRFSDF